MSTKLSLSGMVLDQGTEKPLSGAIIRIETPAKVYATLSNQYGEFTLEPFDEPPLEEGQTTYPISFFAYDKEGHQQDPTPLVKEIKKGESTHYVKIKMINRGPISNSAGRLFLIGLILFLVGLIGTYFYLHRPDSKNVQSEINGTIVQTLTDNLVKRITEDSITVSTCQVVNDSIKASDQAYLLAELKEIEEASLNLFNASQIDSSIQDLIKQDLQDVRQGIDRRNKAEIQTALISSKANIKEAPKLKPSWFWRTTPKLYLEILFWALFATVLRLIGNTSYFVSRNIFLRDSILHKLALLFTIPLLALLITFVISFFKIVISLGGANLALDFSHVYVSIILASLIGLSPWKAWDFMYDLADLLFNSLNKWLGLGKNDPAQKVAPPKEEDPPKVEEEPVVNSAEEKPEVKPASEPKPEPEPEPETDPNPK